MKTAWVGIAGIMLLHLTAPVAPGLSINDPGVVGIVDANKFPTNSKPKTEFEFAQIILELSESEIKTGVPGYKKLKFIASDINSYVGPLDPALVAANPSWFKKTEYGSKSGEIPLPVSGFVDIPEGYEYAMAKYNGPNAGWVLFALNDVTTAGIPVSSASIWTNKGGKGYEISHLTAFNVFSVPDGGSVLAMLGVSLLGLAWFRSRTGARSSRVA